MVYNNKDTILPHERLTAMNAIRAYYERNKTLITLLGILTLCIFACYLLPQFMMSLPKGHDIYYHMYRLESLSVEIKNGELPARIYTNMYRGYGYASPIFYGDWMMFPFALLVTWGVSVLDAYTAYVVSMTFLVGWSMFFSARYIFGSDRAGFVAALTYVFSSYFFTDLLYRHAAGEMQSFVFLPIVMAGAHNIVFGDCKKWYLLGLGLCGVLISHVLTAVATVVFLVIFCICGCTRLFKEPKRFLYVVSAAVVFFASSATFIFPMIEQMQSTKFISTDGTSASAYGTLLERTLPDLMSLFSPINTQTQSAKWWYPNGIGFAFIAAIAVRITGAFNKDEGYKGKQTWIYMGLALLALLASSAYFPWDIFQDLCATMQFPWRLMVFATLFSSLFMGGIASALEKRSAYFTYVCTIVALSAVCFALFAAPKYTTYIKNQIDGKTEHYDYEFNVGLGEWLPTGSNRQQLIMLSKKGDVCLSNNLKSGQMSVERHGAVLSAKFEGNSYDDTYIDLPLVAYKGYEIWLYSDDGGKIKLDWEYSKYNCLRLNIPSEVESGYITAYYKGTTVQHISQAVTVITFVIYAAYLMCRYIILPTRRKALKQLQNDSPRQANAE